MLVLSVSHLPTILYMCLCCFGEGNYLEVSIEVGYCGMPRNPIKFSWRFNHAERQSLRLVFNFVIPIKTLWQKDRKRYNNFYTEWSGFASQERSNMLRALCWINISSDFPLFHFRKHHKCICTPYLTSLLHIIICTEIWIWPCRVCRSGGWYIVSCNWHFSQWKL